jgi:3-hydroxyacyl-CoA dehydrogenase/enoyl-CoA hydratase/3-hydroxybutyryl-CoA epimerase
VKIDKQAYVDLGDKYKLHPGMAVAQKIVALGRIGKKAGKGFYEYPEGGKKFLWPGLAEQFPRAAKQPSVDELVQRFVAIQSIESARCMEEGVLTTARDADVGSILGWGFPPFRGGTISQIHSVGVANFVAQCDELAERHGERFKPTQSLRDMAAKGEAFYER